MYSDKQALPHDYKETDNMRQIDTGTVTAAVKALCIEANYALPDDLVSRIAASRQKESDPLCREVLSDLLANLDAAKEWHVPICQDTGMAVLFIRLGQEVALTGGDFTEAVNRGVREAYLEGNLRCSVVRDPLRRVNTDDNTPAVIHLELVPGDKLEITAAPKGFGSENMSAIRMMNPSASEADIVAFVTDTVLRAGSKPCPPVVIGVGLGGDFELCAKLAKKALCRPLSERHPDPYYAKLEQVILDSVNQTGIGAQGFGGDITALAVNVETYPTHIAGLPVAVNIGCHVTRHKTVVI